MPDANKFYEQGVCEECKQTTDIRARGCNYMMATFPIDQFIEDETKH
jgi:hypothetical protein